MEKVEILDPAGGAVLGEDLGSRYLLPLAAPAAAGPFDLLARARDFAGNTDSKNFSTLVEEGFAPRPPSIALQAPPEAAAGTRIFLEAAADETGIETVTLLHRGRVVEERSAPPSPSPSTSRPRRRPG